MKTREDAVICLDSKHAGRMLKIIEAWKGSSLVVKVYPDSVFAGMSIMVGNPQSGKYIFGAYGSYHPVGKYWRFSIPPTKFTTSGETMYKIDGIEADDGSTSHICGEGILRISSPSLESEDESDDDDEGVR